MCLALLGRLVGRHGIVIAGDLRSSGGISTTVAAGKERTGLGFGGISIWCTKTADKFDLHFLVGGILQGLRVAQAAVTERWP